ncbi:CapA family protein [Pseudoalteromonas denitrificans]|uniref:Capsule synthesis protein PGA_cap n=1 Tax=Pseudoalteromonas denitrificans DSM 6059 TaxID=1123010 RepID=A0A1I1N259_9GAMM|nr:CapA family protein [Pseudoalteromonas denitrificans]SFC88933.1 capsule synthesis protein PGA_cap [Pseudoalteromonas denitrificans DSM 6059]
MNKNIVLTCVSLGVIATLACSTSSVVQAKSLVNITGSLMNEQDALLKNATISLNGKEYKTDTQGRYSISVEMSDIYRLKFSSPAYYSGIQTFSHYELSQQNMNIKPVELVKKVKGRTLFAFGGDVMMGRRFVKPKFDNQVIISSGQEAKDTKSIVENMRPYMSLADFSSVNLETQIADSKPSQRAPKSVTFYSPPETLSALEWVGIDFVTLGNNHTYDYMDSGLKSTLNYLDKSILNYAGAGINQTDALKAHHQSLNGTEYAFLGYVGWEGGFTPNQTATNDKGGAAFGSIDNIIESVSREVADDKATIVQYHGSLEYKTEPTLVTEQRLKTAIDTGADMAIAHHPHVTQGFEIYNDKLIAYSMGNFIFDQYFYATPHSFVLYVWMDGDRFHRAEIIPVYLKGYKPTPATGMHRYTVLKRLDQLSQKRGLKLAVSGGHGIISTNKSSTKVTQNETVISTLAEQTAYPLYHTDWNKNIQRVISTDNTLQYRLGVNLVNGSDFESFDTFNTSERGWNMDQNDFSLTQKTAASGQYAMVSNLKRGGKDVFAMTNFRRVYNASSPMTIQTNIKVATDTKINFYWQGRKNKDKFSHAIKHAEKHLIETVTLDGKEGWTNLEVAFNSQRVGYRSFRILLEIEDLSGNSNTVYLDDVNLIEWQSAFNKMNTLPILNEGAVQASFIGFDKPSNEKITIRYQ